MYVVSFYSFKGGVGRTLALANVAADLVRRGKRVLVVDFDLEAPGLPTIPFFGPVSDRDGLVEYVSEYRRTRQSPDVRSHVAACRREANGGELWLMPAGKQDGTYSARLAHIDWQHLYSVEDGYLMFEDLKEQWRESLKPDYVLIDSRTGHTDVGGICTRQLADAVVVLFFPNEQNVSGLRHIVRSIRAEEEPPRSKRVDLHFVASNVPYLDDEDGILQERISEAKKAIGYTGAATIIHHYDSLSLLNQQLFVVDHPKSRLALEYSGLATAIAKLNPRDRDGALAFLSGLQGLLPALRIQSTRGRFTDFEERLSAIAAAHPKDSEILAEMADIREGTGDTEAALNLLDAAIDNGLRTARAYSRRGVVRRRLAQNEGAVADFIAVLAASDAKQMELYVAVKALTELRPEALATIQWGPTLKKLDAAERLPLFSEAMVSTAVLPGIELALRESLKEANAALVNGIRTQLVLNLIAQRRYEEAMGLLGDTREQILKSSASNVVFNYAMAEWANRKVPPVDLFARAVELSLGKEAAIDANYAQCLAIASHWTGKQDVALAWIERARQLAMSNPRRVFSAWRYLEVLPKTFEEDLKAIERLIRGESECPVFFSEAIGAEQDTQLELGLKNRAR